MNERIDLIFSSVHEKCGREIRQRDLKIKTQKELDVLIRKTLWEGKLAAIDLYCPYCFEALQPTDIEILIDEQSVMKRKINEFLPNKWKMILN